MNAQASIEVQFKPFRLSLIRGNDGQWVAALYRIGDEAVPVVVGYSVIGEPGTGARVTLSSGTPRLAVGTAMFSLPTKQLQRVRDWIEAQNTLVLDHDQITADL
ncbi:hypothetical protein [Luteimonas saliphila]|uniref:hypothetical protein n=1 Tax=Luteimonas saliphila TaxID=2804919 RepID=UPI00192DB844|nr:hypothetical protein [Luteimonas saliphila]